MCLTEFDQELYDRNRRREGEKAGFEKGKEEKAKEAAISFYKNGVSIELIAKSLDMTIEQVKQIVSNAETVEQ